MKHCLLPLLIGIVQGERHILTCCRFAKFNGRDYEVSQEWLHSKLYYAQLLSSFEALL